MANQVFGSEKHIFQKFDEELSALVEKFLAMGGLVEKQIADAVRALTEMDSELANAVTVNEEQVDDLDIEIDQLCVRLIAMRQPTASDLRLIMGVSKSVKDLERIGDEADKIARLTIELADHSGHNQQIGRRKLMSLSSKVSQLLRQLLDAYGRLDADMCLSIARKDKEIDEEYQEATRELVTYMMEDPRCISAVLNVMWALRSLERVNDHIENLAEHLIYTVKGIDIRHSTMTEIRRDVANRGSS